MMSARVPLRWNSDFIGRGWKAGSEPAMLTRHEWLIFVQFKRPGEIAVSGIAVRGVGVQAKEGGPEQINTQGLFLDKTTKEHLVRNL
ncbi:hypothetical protein ETR_17569 [Erwinia tracheiphila PSU-1]|nr:hypothetical protein ETR_17569 [Erwinia tracheiphila PSU-1]